MRTLFALFALTGLAVVAGCQSNQANLSSQPVEQETASGGLVPAQDRI